MNKDGFHSPFRRSAGTSDKTALTKADGHATLAGGKEGQGQGEALSTVSSAVSESSTALALVTALDALVDMFAATLVEDRTALDKAFETLVEVVEEWRDEVPKA